jgi:hypothetical protein
MLPNEAESALVTTMVLPAQSALVAAEDRLVAVVYEPFDENTRIAA